MSTVPAYESLDALERDRPGSRRRRDFIMRRLLALADAAAICVALLVTAEIQGHGRLPLLLWGFLALPAWTLILKVYGLYERDHKRISHGTIDDIPWLFHAVLVGSIATWAWFQLVPGQDLAIGQVLVFACAAFGALIVGRFLLREVSHLLLSAEGVLFVGATTMGGILARKIASHPEYGLEPVGFLGAGDAAVAALPRLGAPEDLRRVVGEHDISRVIFVADAVDQGLLVELIRVGTDLDLKLSVLPDMHDVLGPSVEIDSVEGIAVLGLNPPVLSRSSKMLKRTIDVVLSAAVLTVMAPVMAVIAVMIRADGAGPILFRQWRIGRDGTRFQMLKFRTMVPDAERQRAELLALSKDEGWLHLEDDPRVTRVGRVLRHFSLDELPQLWNVLCDDMSIVGPRPLIEDEDSNVAGWGRRRLDLTPGITGLWQVLGRTSIPFEEMIKLDYLYVTSWSLWGDLRIIAQTLPAVLRRRGVN